MHPLHPERIIEGSHSWSVTLKLVFWVNWILCVANLLPAFPFDGGRIYRAALQVTPSVITPEARPGPLRQVPGMVARLDEQVVDPGSLVGTLADLRREVPAELAQADAEFPSPGQSAQVIQADVRELERVSEATKGADAVVHLAASTGVIPSIENPLFDCEANVLGTLNTLRMVSMSDALSKLRRLSSTSACTANGIRCASSVSLSSAGG